jgi:hypothetical protein
VDRLRTDLFVAWRLRTDLSLAVGGVCFRGEALLTNETPPKWRGENALLTLKLARHLGSESVDGDTTSAGDEAGTASLHPWRNRRMLATLTWHHALI